MNKRTLALIMATAVLVLCFLSPFAGAVTISYTADSGGESVSLSVSATGDAELHLEGEEGDNKAGHYATVESGT